MSAWISSIVLMLLLNDRVHKRIPLLVAELGEPILVEPEVVPELVKHGDADLAFQLDGVVKRLLERTAVDRDRVRAVVAALVEAEKVGVVRVLVFDDDGDVLEAARELGRERVERPADV